MKLKIFKKFEKYNKYYMARTKYSKYYNKLSIDKYSILLESQHGKELNGNIFYLLDELATNPQYSNFKIYVSAKKYLENRFKNIVAERKWKNVHVVVFSSKEYFKVLASTKYLINDTSFFPFFVKKDEQVYLNVWHGTPLKTLGKQIKNDCHNIGNVQKNFIVADYLLYTNEYTMKHMIDDYMISNLSNAKILLSGYPRNTAFFDYEKSTKIKEEMKLQDKKVYAYMPTWRGKVSRIDNKNNTYLLYYLFEMEKRLKDDEILYVNLHPFAKKNINFKQFKKIRQFPAKYETYEFLNIADCLITDYSSVFFDFAITRKKIILFTYDKEEYLADRGMYLNMEELPFPQVDNVEDLMQELNTPIQYDDIPFLKTYCRYECENATKLLCDRVILNKNNDIIEQEMLNNGKENVLIYVGNLAKNGITSSMMNMLQSVDTQKYNYYITFVASYVAPHKEILLNLPEGVNYISTTGIMNLTLFEKVIMKLFDKKRIGVNLYLKIMKKSLKLELKRTFCNIKFSNVIQFNGYEYKKLFLFSLFNTNRTVFVHSDMNKEIETRNNQRRNVLEYSYKNYDNVALVTDDLVESTKKFTNGSTKNFVIINNLIDYKTVKDKSYEDIVLDKTTVSNVSYDRLIEVLQSENKKFINIGRFSPEKGQIRLIDSFYRVWKDNKDVYLIIIGGLGKDYNKIKNKVASMECKDNIILIKGVSNPYTILNKCDYFVLSSYYEGFGLVIAEADILGKPAISTNITGPKTFMQNNNGTLVEDSEDGIYNGMIQMLEGKVKLMNVDYEKYNSNAINQFEGLLNNNKTRSKGKKAMCK